MNLTKKIITTVISALLLMTFIGCSDKSPQTNQSSHRSSNDLKEGKNKENSAQTLHSTFIIVGKNGRIFKSRYNGYLLTLRRISPAVIQVGQKPKDKIGQIPFSKFIKDSNLKSRALLATIAINDKKLNVKITKVIPKRSYSLFAIESLNGEKLNRMNSRKPISIIINAKQLMNLKDKSQ